MELRNGTVVGGGVLPPQHRALFEEGVQIIFTKWTALNLAVEGEWGGPLSREKALHLMQDIAEWFYRRKEHWEDELEMELADGMLHEFNAELEDGSPAEVAKTLLELYNECCQGLTGVIGRLRALPSNVGTSQRQMAGGEDDETSSSGDEDDGSDADMADAPAAVGMQQAERQHIEPVVDDDGFELVQRRGRRR